MKFDEDRFIFYKEKRLLYTPILNEYLEEYNNKLDVIIKRASNN
jgi:hypothetical protein